MLSAVSLPGRGLHAPLFEQVIQGLDLDRRQVILDCGAARSGTIALLSAFRCRLDVLDLAETLPSLKSADDPGERRNLLADRLTCPHQEPVQLVLCWNLLNYLQPSDIETLADLLAARLATGGRLHALIEYSSPLMPASPGHWVPDESGRLYADQAETEETPAPRYSPKALERLMPQFRPERSVLLGNGLREHLFQLRCRVNGSASAVPSQTTR